MKKKRILLGLGALATLSLATFLASCDEKKFTVKFYDGSKELTELAETVTNGYNATVPTAPTKDGFVFNGWYVDEALTTQYDFGSIVSGDLSIYARWLDTFNVTFKDGNTTLSTVTVKKGEYVTKPANPTKASDANFDYEFAGWFTDETLTTEYKFNTNITAATTVYAKFAAISKDTKIKMNGTEYATIKEALAAVPTDSTETFTITLPKGTYEENGLAYNGKATIHIKGNTNAKYGADVIIKGHGADMTTEKGRSLIAIQGTGNIILENVTLVTDWSRTRAAEEGISSNTQAEVLGTDTTGNTVAYNCGFKSNQDTLRTAGKAWFYGCYIEGDVDFIWMEQAGTVALYEKCEIVSVYDKTATSHYSYLTAPRMTVASKVGKGLVIYNSTVKESAEAIENGQKTYLARTPWSSGYYNQVAYINTTCENIEADVWYKTQIATDYAKTVIGWKMDQATATSLGYEGNNDILDADTTTKEFGGRKTILNRIYNVGKQKYEKDTANNWDIDALIKANKWTVTADSSSDVLTGEVIGETTTYKFDGSVDQSALCSGFAQETGKAHYVGNADSTITIPVTGKSYVEVYGYYAGTVETKAGTQGEQVMFFNNGTTDAEVMNTYAVYDASITSVVITAKAKTYITKVVVTTDSTIKNTAVTNLEIEASTETECVGVALDLTAKVTPSNATNKTVKWTSSDTSVGEIDEYTGRVTFKNAGEVTFTATACDGSGKTASITCHPIAASWSVAEFYIAKDAPDATGISGEASSNFTVGDIYNGNVAPFKNLAGETITTNRAAKMNGGGYVKFATTKDAYVTIVMADRGKTVEAVLSVTGENGGKATLVSQTGDSKFPTLVYKLEGADSWTIKRGGSSELNVIAYVKVEYDAVWDFKTATPSTITTTNIQKTTGTVVSNQDKVSLTVDASNNGKLQYNSKGYAQFNNGTIIKVPVVNVGSVITVVSYSGQSNYTIGSGEGQIPADTSTDTDVYTVKATDVEKGYVEIIATSTAYIYSITLSNPR